MDMILTSISNQNQVKCNDHYQVLGKLDEVKGKV